MMDDDSTLNDTERKVRDYLSVKLGTRAVVLKVKQNGDRIELQILSPNYFTWTADTLDKVGAEIAELSKCTLSVSLTTWWPLKKFRRRTD